MEVYIVFKEDQLENIATVDSVWTDELAAKVRQEELADMSYQVSTWLEQHDVNEG